MSVSRISYWRGLVTRKSAQPSTRRFVHQGDSGSHGPSRHAQFYSDLVPAMIPVALLGSAVYMVCQLILIATSPRFGLFFNSVADCYAGSTALTDVFGTREIP